MLNDQVHGHLPPYNYPPESQNTNGVTFTYLETLFLDPLTL